MTLRHAWLYFSPALSVLEALKPLSNMRILLEQIRIPQIFHHLTIWKVEEISKRDLISGKIFLFRENLLIPCEGSIQTRGVVSELSLVWRS